MNFDGLSDKKIEQKSAYSEKLENLLGLTVVVKQLEEEFDKFANNPEKKIKENEQAMLRLIKIFLYKNENTVRNIIKNSKLPGFDCLSTSVMACLLAGRKGYAVTIGKPDKLAEYFHAFILMHSGEIFEMAEKNQNTSVVKMTVEDVLWRIRYMKPIMRYWEDAKGYVKK